MLVKLQTDILFELTNFHSSLRVVLEWLCVPKELTNIVLPTAMKSSV